MVEMDVYSTGETDQELPCHWDGNDLVGGIISSRQIGDFQSGCESGI
jgi:hypothetical protein